MSTKLLVTVLLGLAAASAVLGGLVASLMYWTTLLAFTALAMGFGLIAAVIRDRLVAIEQRISTVPQATSILTVSELHSMAVIMQRFPECTIPTTGWSMRFTNLHSILDLLDEVLPQNIVEFGSGLSTIMVAAWLRERGTGRLVSFDHDPDWAARTRRCLSGGKLDAYANVFSVPLVPYAADIGHIDWYDISQHQERLAHVDLVIIDGPPGGTPSLKLSRLPALEQLAPKLSSKCALVLDDAFRPGEQQILTTWKRQFPAFQLSFRGETTGLAILTRESDSSTSQSVVDSAGIPMHTRQETISA